MFRTASRRTVLALVALTAACSPPTGAGDTGAGDSSTTGDTRVSDAPLGDGTSDGASPDVIEPDGEPPFDTGGPDVAPPMDTGGPDVVNPGDGEAPTDGALPDSGAPGDATPTDEGPGADAREGGTFTGPGCVPGAAENCDGLDNNCDGRIDESCPCMPGATQRCYGSAPGLAGVGVCTFGMQECMGGEIGSWGACIGYGVPSEPRCDGVDRACNNDPFCLRCPAGETRSCYTGPMGTEGVGTCRAGTQTCRPMSEGGGWTPCEGQRVPEPNLCDGIDRACTGDPSIGCTCVLGEVTDCYTGPMGTEGRGLCRAGTQRCILGGDGRPTLGACMGQVLPAGPNVCDGVDRACEGRPRTDCGCTAGMTEACYTGPMATRGMGRCRDGARSCVVGADGTGAFGGACMGEVLPASGGETCDNMLDDDCDGMVDEMCGCAVGSTQPCYSGPMGTMGMGVCRGGTQACSVGADGVARFSGACTGEVLPTPGGESCGNMLDDDCDGMIDEGCSCRPGVDTRACYTGPGPTRMVGACRDGVNRCVAPPMGTSGAPAFEGACTGQVLPSLELCNNMIDDDCDGMVDEECVETCISAGDTAWQVLRSPDVTRYGAVYAECGYSNEFNVYLPSDRIARLDDPAWRPVMSPQIDFGTLATDPDRRSPLTDVPACACGAANQPRCGNYTLFQTYFNLPANPITGNANVDDFFIRFRRANNAVRVTIYNSGTSGTGINFNRFYVTNSQCDGAATMGEIRGETTVFRPGLNRIVLTLLDDCPGQRELTGVEVFLNGRLVNPCRTPE